MTILRANGASWAVGDKFTSAQANAMDLNSTFALDKRAGQTDTLASIVSCGGSGRIVDTYAAGPNANTTFLMSGANSIINAAAITTFRTYTLSNTGAIAGDRLMVLNPTNFALTVKDAAATTLIILGPNTSLEGESTWADFLFNGTAWILWRSAKATAPSPLVVPSGGGIYVVSRGITQLLLLGWGGGGGGGGGNGANGVHINWASSGGGGGGASLVAIAVVTVTPGGSYLITMGAAGTAGPANGSGGDGGDTTFGALATFTGAQGGICGLFGPAGANSVISYGGSSTRDTPRSPTLGMTDPTIGAFAPASGPGVGGIARAFDGLLSFPSGQGGGGGNGGRNSSGGFVPGTGALGGGTSSSSYYSGGGGAGGAAGPAGVGGNGGVGGASSGAATGASGTAGTAAATGTGAGGGGGGAGGYGATGQGLGAVGGAGGSGGMIVIPLR